MKYKKKLLGFIAVITILPFAVLGSLFYSNERLREKHAIYEYSVNQMSYKLDAALTEMRFVAENLSTSPTLQICMDTVDQIQSKNEQIDEMRMLDKLIQNSKYSKTIHGIKLYFVAEKMYTSEQISYYPFDRFTTDPRYTSPGSIGCYSLPGLSQGSNGSETISYYKLISSTRRPYFCIGAIAVDISLEYLMKLADVPKGFDMDSIVLRNDAGEDIFSLGKPVSDELLDMAAGSEWNGKGSIISVKLPQTGWGIFAQPSSFVGITASKTYWIILITLAVLVLTVVCAIANGIESRVGKLISRLSYGTDQENAGSSPHRRLLSLERLDDAVKRTDILLEKQRQQLSLQYDTQLKLLQAQINPHFLYNALDCANWLIQSGDQDHASETVLAIGKYYRLTLNRGKDIHTLEKEIELVKAYIAIQICRFDSRIVLHINMQPEAAECLIPKMTLQPLVENSIVHGFCNDLQDARIDIDANVVDGYLYIIVTDNGSGIPEHVKADITHISTPKNGFGLFAVDQRCKLFSKNDACGLTIESEEHSFTSVSVKVKAVFE